jgi:hypothetical protein
MPATVPDRRWGYGLEPGIHPEIHPLGTCHTAGSAERPSAHRRAAVLPALHEAGSAGSAGPQWCIRLARTRFAHASAAELS